MLTFIHTYTEDSFPGLAARGLWRDGDGLKLMHKPGFVPPNDFNTAAAPGSKLESLLRSLRCPFYIDRLQGGLGYDRRYPYDRKIVEHYRSLLGESFLGFQIHEWASNFRSDQQRIAELFRKLGEDPDDPAAWARTWEKIVSGEESLFLEAYAPEEWRERRLSRGLAGFLRDAAELYRLRAEETGGLMFPADSYFMAPRTELAAGARLLLPEAGWQIPNLRVQIALTRGMADAAGVPWGIYYECWQNTKDAGFTIPFSLTEGQDEWLEDLLHKGNGSSLPPGRRERGGSSLSLMERAWRLAYFSGARYLAEEYGVCNTFRDLKTFELSPYGDAKRGFLRFTEEFPDIGTPFVPAAAVLPKEMTMLDVTLGERYLEHPFTDPACPLPPDGMRRFLKEMTALYGEAGRFGNMGHVIKNGGLPGVCDIVYEDMPEALARYEFLVDLTGKNTLEKKYRVAGAKEADGLLDGLLPCRVGGGLFTAYNRLPDGWFVMIMNNDGVYHDNFEPDVLLPEASVRAPVVLRDPAAGVKKAAGSGELRFDGSEPFVALGAGEWLMLRLTD